MGNAQHVAKHRQRGQPRGNALAARFAAFEGDGAKPDVGEQGDDLGGVSVTRILRDRVVLLGPAGEEELWLSFAGSRAGSNMLSSAGTAAPGPGEPPSLEVNRFGKRVGEGR